MQHLTPLIFAIGIIGVIVGIWAYRGFRLRVWKETTYFFVGGVVAFTAGQFFIYMDIPNGFLIRNLLELTAVIGFSYGILKIKTAAEMTGA